MLELPGIGELTILAPAAKLGKACPAGKEA